MLRQEGGRCRRGKGEDGAGTGLALAVEQQVVLLAGEGQAPVLGPVLLDVGSQVDLLAALLVPAVAVGHVPPEPVVLPVVLPDVQLDGRDGRRLVVLQHHVAGRPVGLSDDSVENEDKD